MYPRIENSVHWSAHPESRTDRPQAAASRGRGACAGGGTRRADAAHGWRWGALALADSYALMGVSPCYSDASDQALPPGLLRATPPRPLFSRTPSPARNAIVGAQTDGVEFGNPFIMQRQQWAMDMAMDESRLPPGAHGAGSYSSHPKDSTGTWAGDAAVISQIDAFRAFRSQ